MKRRGVVVPGLLLAAFLTVPCGVFVGQTGPAKGSSGVTVVKDQAGGPVSLKVGAMLEVRLDANHTTGYSWIAGPVADPVLVRQGAAKYEEHASEGKAGVGGVEVWRFKAVKAGKQRLQFEYRRPWEKSVPAAKTVTYSVTVE